MSQPFHISDTNPNPNEVCIAGGQGNPDCQGPYAIFHLQSRESNLDPHAVICASCAGEVVRRTKEHQEVTTIDGEAIEVPDEPDEPDSTEDQPERETVPSI